MQIHLLKLLYLGVLRTSYIYMSVQDAVSYSQHQNQVKLGPGANVSECLVPPFLWTSFSAGKCHTNKYNLYETRCNFANVI